MLKIIFFCCIIQVCVSRKFNNPILNSSELESPGVVKYNGLYYAVGAFKPSNSMPIYVSSDLENWEVQGYVFDQNNLPRWCNGSLEIDSPEIRVMEDGSFNIYFTATHALSEDRNRLSIGVATASDILGPYTSTETALIVNDDSNMGATLLKVNSDLYIYYSTMNGSAMSYIVGQRLTEDGLSLLDSQPTLILAPDQTLFYFGYYGASLFFKDGYYYLFFSRADSCTFYSTDGLLVARSKSHLGPFEVLDRHIIYTYDDYRAPAQPSIVKDLDDESDVLLFHTFNTGNCNTRSHLTAVSLKFDSDGWPSIQDYP